MSYTLGQAAKATGKSKSTIKNALEKGWISGLKSESGEWKIDPAELHRRYTMVSDEPGDILEHVEQPNIDILLRLKEAEVRLEEVQKRMEEKDVTIGDLRTRLDGAERRVTALLPQATEPTAPRRRGFWQWFKRPDSASEPKGNAA